MVANRAVEISFPLVFFVFVFVQSSVSRKSAVAIVTLDRPGNGCNFDTVQSSLQKCIQCLLEVSSIVIDSGLTYFGGL